MAVVVVPTVDMSRRVYRVLVMLAVILGWTLFARMAFGWGRVPDGSRDESMEDAVQAALERDGVGGPSHFHNSHIHVPSGVVAAADSEPSAGLAPPPTGDESIDASSASPSPAAADGGRDASSADGGGSQPSPAEAQGDSAPSSDDDQSALSAGMCKDFDVEGFQRQATVEGARFLFMEPMRVGYGLTNQLMAYAALILFGMTDNRTIVMPPARTPFSQIVSLGRSRYNPMYRGTGSFCEDVAAGGLPGIRMKHKRFFFMRKALSRKTFVTNPNLAMRKMFAFMRNVEQIPTVKVWDMYGRWPFGTTYLPKWHSFPWFMCATHFNDAVESQTAIAYADLARAALRFHEANASSIGYEGTEQRAVYVAVHLRMEPQDMFSMGRSWSNASQVVDFFLASVFPLADAKRTRTVMLCSGKLAEDVEAAIRQAGSMRGYHIVRKTMFNISIPEEAALTVDSHGIVLTPTNSFGAVIDLLLLERAAAVVMTAYSSFTASVYSRRCCRTNTDLGVASHNDTDSAFSDFGGGPQEGSVHMYEVYMDGTLTRTMEYPCGQQIEEYVVSSGLPPAPPEKSIFKATLTKSNPLFTEHFRNEGPILVPPNSTDFVITPPPKKYIKVKRQYRKVIPRG